MPLHEKTANHMRKKIFVVFSLFLVVIMWGCAAEEPLPTNASPPEDPTIALVNGQPVSRSRLLAVMLPGYGPKILDDLVLLEIVRQQAAQQSIYPSDQQTSQELDLILEDMAPGKSRDDQLSLLNYLLNSRGVVRPVFDLIVQKQSLLRQMIDPNMTITEATLTEEYERQYGQKVAVRQLVVSSFRLVEIARQKIKNGESFARIIEQMSQDQPSLARGGLLGPFSQVDENIPQPLRRAAFQLKQPGRISEPIMIPDEKQDEWWYLLELVDIIPAQAPDLEQVRDQLIQTHRHRTINQRMLELQDKLKSQAHIQVLDPQLLRKAD